MPKREYSISDSNGDKAITFWIDNDLPIEQIESKILQYAYHNMIFNVLILAQDHSILKYDDLMDYMEFFEEQRFFVSKGGLLFISKAYPTVLNHLGIVIALYKLTEDLFRPGWQARAQGEDFKWRTIRETAKDLLATWNIPSTTNLAEYENEYVGDLSFLRPQKS